MYWLKKKGELKAIIIATGSEVSLAMEAHAQLEGVRVVSMPCAEEFVKQDAAYREAVLPSNIRARVAVEAAHVDLLVEVCRFRWSCNWYDDLW